jgi:hypothetical protein
MTKDKIVTFTCPLKHITRLTINSFGNKRRRCNDDPEMLCTECFKNKNKKVDDFDEEKEKALENSGHTLLTLTEDRKVTYQCGVCNEVSKCSLSNLRSNKGHCSKCQNWPFKNNEDDVKKTVEEIGYSLVSYVDYHHVIMKCDKGHTYTGSLFGIKRGRRCPTCAPDRRKETNLRIYGAENPFQSEEIKARIVATNLEKYGVTHAMKLPEIRAKAQETMLEKYGVKFAFHSAESFRKIRETCIDRYGAPFPFQSPFIQAKIRETFMRLIGSPYPMCNQTYWKDTMIAKYGVDHYIGSEHCRQACIAKYGVDTWTKTPEFWAKYATTCMARYGVDHYSKTSEFQIKYKATCIERYGVDNYSKTPEFLIKYKATCVAKYGVDCYTKTPEFWVKYTATCMARYGVDYPAQNPVIFEKMTRSRFSRKEYAFPSGKTAMIMGYEPQCVTTLLETHPEEDIIVTTADIPVIKYLKLRKKADGTEFESMGAYYPDILLPDRLIEVKSTYTYSLDVANNERKFKECAKQGHKLELWIYKDAKTLAIKRVYEGDAVTTIYDHTTCKQPSSIPAKFRPVNITINVPKQESTIEV